MTSPTAESAKDRNLTGDDKLIVEALIAECRDTGERIVTLLTSLERILATGAAVLAIAASVVVASNKSYFLMLLPAALSVVLIYAEFVNNDIKSMGAYKAALEVEITRRLRFPVISWESTVVKLGQFNRIYQWALASMTVLGLGGSIVIALVQAFATLNPNHWGHNYSTLYIIGTCVSIGVGLWAVVKGFLAHERNMGITKDEVNATFEAARAKAKHESEQAQHNAASAPPTGP